MKQINLYWLNGGGSSVPDGKTVLPTDDVTIWQQCGETGTTFTSLAQILSNMATLVALMSNDNAVDYLVRSTTWTSAIIASMDAMKAIGASDYASTTLLSDNTWNTAIQGSTYFEYVDNAKIPLMTSDNTPSGYLVSGNYPEGGSHKYYMAFDDDTSTYYQTPSSSGDYTPLTNPEIDLSLPSAFALKYISIYVAAGTPSSNIYTNTSLTIKGSTDGDNYSIIETEELNVVGNNYDAQTWNVKLSNSDTPYSFYKLIWDKDNNLYMNRYHYLSLYEANLYGRETGGVQTWLRSAGITNKTYTTLAEVLADSTTLSALMADNNAVDYLVTAKAWASTICADSTAMSYIGLNNYASDTLLGDETWFRAICGSAYKSSVINVYVPAMTSDTTPSGAASANSVLGENWKAYKGFDGNSNTQWCSNNNGSASNIWLMYEFPSAVKCYGFAVEFDNYVTAVSYEIQGGDSYLTLSDTFTNISKVGTFNQNIGDYRKYRLYINSTTVSGGVACGRVSELQFYGRKDV